MDPRMNRGPVIERANEPGIPRGMLRLLVVAAVLGGVWWAGYWPDRDRIDRVWQDTVVAANDLWTSWTGPSAPPPPATRPVAAPTQTARAPIAPPISRPSPSPSVQPGAVAPVPPPPPPFNVNQIIADAKRAIGETTSPPAPKPPEATAPSADPFAQAFRRDILGQLNAPGSPPTPAPPVVASAPQPSPPPERTSLFPRAPGLPAPPYTPETLDQFVERELNAFNASRDVPVKRAAMEKIAAAAQVGHGPARGVIVRGFPVSTIIRDVVTPADVIRFSLDFVIHKRAFSNDARRDFIALAAWFDGERKDGPFGEGVFDAVRDDSRLQTPDAMNDLMVLLYRAERGCIALRRHINVFDPNTTTTGHCGLDLAGATPQKARQAGPAGVEPKRFREGLELLQKSLGAPT